MTLEQTTNPTTIPLTGLGYGPMTSLYGQQLVPQSPIGNILSQLGSVSPYAVNPQLALQAQLGAILSQLGVLQPFGVGQQFGLQLGNQTYQVTVKSIEDGRVILARHDQEIVVPLRRK